MRRRAGDAVPGAAGFGVFALAGALCSLPDDLAGMLAFRALQAAGAALALVAAFALLGGGRLWTTAAVFGTAVGPALGGLLTQAVDWRAIFLFQVPLGAAAAAACLASRRAAPPVADPAAAGTAIGDSGRDARSLVAHPGGAGALVALACLSAALTAVLVPARAAAGLRLVAGAARGRGGRVGAARSPPSPGRGSAPMPP